MQNEVLVLHVRVFVDVVHALRVERGSAALDAVNLVALGKKKLRQVRAVLARDAGDEGFLNQGSRVRAEWYSQIMA